MKKPLDTGWLGDIPAPCSQWKVEQEGVDILDENGVDTSNPMYTNGLRTSDLKEYDRQRYQRLLKEGRVKLKGFKCKSNPDGKEWTHNKGENNPNYRHGRYVK